MSIDDIVRAWKSDEEDSNTESLTNPVGEELTEEALLEVAGGMYCKIWSCDAQVTCEILSIW